MKNKFIVNIPLCKKFSLSRGRVRDETGLEISWDELVEIQEALTYTMSRGQMEADRLAMYDIADYHARRGRGEDYPAIKEYLDRYREADQDDTQILLDIINAYKHSVRTREINPSKTTSIYLMKDYNTGLTKIGRSTRPKARESTLQSEKPTVVMLWYAPASESDEEELHQRFSDRRVRGEWFNLTDADISSIIKYFGGTIVGGEQ